MFGAWLALAGLQNMFGDLWWSRNKFIHENIRQTSRDVTWVHAYAQEIDSLVSVEQKPTHRPCVKWNRPEESYVRVNFDAVFLQQNHQSFVADMGFTNVEIAGDSRTVISKISSRNLDRSSIGAVEKRR
ncbi:hypothetical protein Gotri_027234 [Gossypium trilobum]|uniref:Uncharacterized protein n=1 Tax=Gossypium trilobum TaxID=34281 RepID=A0A7J9FII9_9ROSI|nr:hypothetical protein [Gossypium trilobum]